MGRGQEAGREIYGAILGDRLLFRLLCTMWPCALVKCQGLECNGPHCRMSGPALCEPGRRQQAASGSSLRKHLKHSKHLKPSPNPTCRGLGSMRGCGCSEGSALYQTRARC